MKCAALVLVLAACNQIYALEATHGPPDAVEPLDLDHDDTPDLVDNCPGLANDQADADEDGRGDICDNCPLVANPQQESAGDGDAVGDACDAHPAVAGDCLIVFDTIANEASFDAHWKVSSMTAQPTKAFADGAVELSPGDTGTVLAIILDDQGNPIAGPTDVNVLGRATLSSANAAVAAVSNASTPGSGYACGMHGQGSDSAPFVFASSSASGASNIPQLGRGLSTEPVDSSLLLRLTTRTEDGGLGCRTAYGLALGTGRLDAGSVVDPGPGAAGIELQEVTLTVDAIAVYRVEPAGCPTSIYR